MEYGFPTNRSPRNTCDLLCHNNPSANSINNSDRLDPSNPNKPMKNILWEFDCDIKSVNNSNTNQLTTTSSPPSHKTFPTTSMMTKVTTL